jgi:hypothetical protein
MKPEKSWFHFNSEMQTLTEWLVPRYILRLLKIYNCKTVKPYASAKISLKNR